LLGDSTEASATGALVADDEEAAVGPAEVKSDAMMSSSSWPSVVALRPLLLLEDA